MLGAGFWIRVRWRSSQGASVTTPPPPFPHQLDLVLTQPCAGNKLSALELDAVMDLIDDDRSGAVNLAEFEQYWREHVEAHATGTHAPNFSPPDFDFLLFLFQVGNGFCVYRFAGGHVSGVQALRHRVRPCD